jgi:hypothetical protein
LMIIFPFRTEETDMRSPSMPLMGITPSREP